MGPPTRRQQHKSPKSKPQPNGILRIQKSAERLVPEPSAQCDSPPSLGMAPETRYQHNLKVLRRRDPTILSIFDQFSHICVYECLPATRKWEKIGCEGSMFLFESSTYPPYGYYILNRTGSQDYISRLYPEDYLSAHGPILAIRHFAQWTNERLSKVKESLGGGPLPGPYDERYIVPDVESLTHEMKGEHSLMGLWYHSDGNREPLSDVMQRLHSFIKRGQSYPEEFRYGPGHPPPPNRLRAVPRSTSSRNVTSSEASDSQASCSESETNDPSPELAKPVESDVERLFAKLAPAGPGPIHSAPPDAVQNHVTVDSLFAKLAASEVSHSTPITPVPAPTGIKLLDTIFASANSPGPQSGHKIYSPTPSASNAPQVLNQDVISTLLGLPPSRSASVASNGARSTTTSRDGDNEEDSDSPRHGSEESRPASTQGHASLLSIPDAVGRNKLGRINGDVTPRALASNLRSPPAPSAIESVSSIATVRPSQPHISDSVLLTTPQASNVKPRANRPLVPFEDDSELWPYSATQESGSNDELDIVELDFEDTSLLSDPDALSKALLKKKNGRANGTTHDDTQRNGKEKGSKGKKKGSRREREAKERAEIEKSWDVPEYLVNYTAQAEARRQQLASPPASPSPPVSPPRVQTPPSRRGAFADAATPTMSAKAIPLVNGHTNFNATTTTNTVPPDTPSAKGRKVAAVNGTNKNHTLDKDLMKNCIITSMDASKSRSTGKAMERNEFVHQLLTLIHTDNTFVDNIYQQYVSRSN